MPKAVVREVQKALGIRVRGFMPLRSGRRDHDASKDRSLTHNYYQCTGSGNSEGAYSN